MTVRAVSGPGFALRPVGDTAHKAVSGRAYSSLLAARRARVALKPQLFAPDRLEIWTCSVRVRDGVEYVKLLEFVE